MVATTIHDDKGIALRFAITWLSSSTQPSRGIHLPIHPVVKAEP